MIRLAPAADLTMDDLERAAFTYGGVIEPRPGGLFVLVGARIGGQRVDLGPVAGVAVSA